MNMLAVDLAIPYASGFALSEYIQNEFYFASSVRYMEVHPTYTHISFFDFRIPLDPAYEPKIRLFEK